MTAIILDGFDHYGSGGGSIANMLAGPYASMGAVCGTPSWGPARTGNLCLLMGANEAGFGRNKRVLPTAGTHFFFSFGFAVDSLVPGTNGIIAFMDGSQNIIAQLLWTSTGVLQLCNSAGTVIVQTSGPAIVSQNWHFMEMEVNTGTGVFNLRLDDAQAVNAPILTTNSLPAGTIAQFSILSGNSGPPIPPQSYMDDLFVRDANGTVNNGFLGDRRIATLFANADTTTTGWSPSYYKEFGAGILTLAYIMAGSSSVQNPFAYIYTNAANALDIGNADFTLETWVRFDAIPTSSYSSIFSRWDVGNNHRSYRLILGSQAFNNGCLQFDTSTDGTVATQATKIQYPWTPLPNVWHHIAVVRAAGELLLFVDGQQLGVPIADSTTYFSGGSEILSIGMEVPQNSNGNVNPTSGTNLIGRLDETRFTNGFGRYTGPFAVPTAAFPRGAGNDPNWAQVALIMGYDGGIADESSYARVVTNNNAFSLQPNDGPTVGKYSAVNKATPDDNTFIQANLINATNVLTLTTQPANGDTVTVGTKDGSIPAVYTFKTAIASAFDVLIDTTAQNTLINLLNAINLGSGAGTKYGTGTVVNVNVNATQLPVGQIQVTANIAGTIGNSIASTSTGTAARWNTATLTGGVNIPGPTNFKLQRPPNNTTLISAMQMNVRALKTDAGTATIQNTFVGGLGGTLAGSAHNLTVSSSYYTDIIEKDPDTSAAITPTTIVNGQLSINRTA